ncbi:MAG: CvpA family protein [Anaerolineae bacterium]
MTYLEEAERPKDRSKGIAALVIATLGTMGIVVFFFRGPRELRGFDLFLLFLVLGFAAYGSMRSIIRGLTTALSIYVATAVAATFYPALRVYCRSLINIAQGHLRGRPPIRPVDYSALALAFALIAIPLWAALEGLFRAALPDAHLRFLGFLDRAAGALVHMVIGIFVATLVFNVFGYGFAGRSTHDKATLRPEAGQVMALYYQSQSFWFPRRPPAIYTYDLDLGE